MDNRVFKNAERGMRLTKSVMLASGTETSSDFFSSVGDISQCDAESGDAEVQAYM